MTETQSTLSRRTFVKGSLAGLAATGAAGTALFGCAPQSGTGAGEEPMAATGEETAPDEIHWSQCNVNCGGNCVFQWHSRDGKVLYMEPITQEIPTCRPAPVYAAAPCDAGSTAPTVCCTP